MPRSLVVILLLFPLSIVVAAHEIVPAITINGDSDLEARASAGNWTGTGTSRDPFVLTNIEIHATSSHGLVVRNTTLHFRIFDIFVVDGEDLYTGIVIENSSHVQIQSCFISRNYHGITVANSSEIELTLNRVLNHNSTGISMSSSDNSSIERNDLLVNREGLKLRSIYESEVLGNTIESNAATGLTSRTSNNNVIAGNVFIDNFVQAISISSTDLWFQPYPIGGNYWSDLTGNDDFYGPDQDQDGADGFVDRPYAITGGAEDPLPWANSSGPSPPPNWDQIAEPALTAAPELSVSSTAAVWLFLLLSFWFGLVWRQDRT